MGIKLTVLRCPDAVAPEIRQLPGGDLRIGRAASHADWVLRDPDHHLSRQHCVLRFDGTQWQLEDTSANGTFLNHETAPVGGTPRALRSGDRLRLGPYEIEVTIEAAASSGVFGASPAYTPAPSASLFGTAEPAPSYTPGFAPPSIALQPNLLEEDFAALLQPPPPAQPDHSPAYTDSFRPPTARPALTEDWEAEFAELLGTPPARAPSPAPYTPPVAAPVAAPHHVAAAYTPTAATPMPVAPAGFTPNAVPAPAAVPPGFAPPGALPPSPAPAYGQAAAPSANPQTMATPATDPFGAGANDPFGVQPADPFGAAPASAAPFAAPAPEPARAKPRPVLPATPLPVTADPFAEPGDAHRPATSFTPPAATAAATTAPAAAAIASAVTPHAAQPAVPAAPDPTAPAGPSDAALLAAFMEGVGLADMTPQDPLTAMRNAGAAFRAFVIGLREALMVRAEVKSAMRIDQTFIRARGNNPLKFSAGDDDALSALLGTGRRVDMTPQHAVAEALRDLRHHEQATMPATQTALRAMLEALNPEQFRLAAEAGGIALPAQRRARAFEAYEAAYGKLMRDLADDFDTVFGRRFGEAYQAMIAELKRAEREP